jgi:hypothetical protein
MTIVGTVLTDTTAVVIGSPCTNLVVMSDTTVTCTTAPLGSGTYPVRVTVAGTVYTGPNLVIP